MTSPMTPTTPPAIPSDIPRETLEAARAVATELCEHAYGMWGGWLPDRSATIIARALLAAQERGKLMERERWKPAATYFDRYCQDEADDPRNCVCGGMQHEDAKAFAAAIREGN